MGEGSSLPSARAWGRGVRGWLAEASDAVVSIFFPAACRICDQLLVRASRVRFCEDCLDSFEGPPENKCGICGQGLAWMTVEEGEPLVCRACKQKTYAFERARSYGVYEGSLVRAILLPKWGGWSRWAIGSRAAGDGRGRAGSPAPGPRTAARVQPSKSHFKVAGSEAGATS